MLSWVDMAGSEMARLINEYRKTNDIRDLREVREAMTTFAAIVDELEHRFHTG